MKDILSYKGFIGCVHFSGDDKVFYGKIEGIDDLVTFEAKDVNSLIKAFREEVNDYLLLCRELGKKPEKSYKGSFNVRIPQEIHKNAIRQAMVKGISLNQFVQKAIEKELQHT